MAGYSDTPLWKKLGLKPGMSAYVEGAPSGYLDLLRLPADVPVTFQVRPESGLSFAHLFVSSRAGYARRLGVIRRRMDPDGTLWVSWPKKSSGVSCDVTEGTVRELALPMGLVDVKVCAVDEVWSGLKFVVRRRLR